jgi:HPt (histidine-containing phosphotransfer) domain-containing protein
MRAHLSKPVDLEALVQAVLTHARSPKTALAQPESPAPALAAVTPALETAPETTPETTQTLIDWGALDQRYNGRQTFIKRVLDMFIEQYSNTGTQLRTTVTSGQLAEVTALAHSLKGMAGNLCAESLQEQARRTEQAARASAPETAQLAEELAQVMDDLLVEIRQRR